MRTDITPDEATRLRRTLRFMESMAPSTNGELDLPIVDHRFPGRKRAILAFGTGLVLVLVALLPVLVLSRDAPTDLSLPTGDSVAPVTSTRLDDGATSTSSADGSENPSVIEVLERGDLTLTLRGDPSNPCLEVLSENGTAGGCGADLDAPLRIGVGSIGDASFVDGWAPEGAVRVVVTLADGAEVEAAELAAVDGYQVRFFFELLPASGGTEPELPITAVAFDLTGSLLAEYTLEDTTEVSQTQPGRGPVGDAELPSDVEPGTVVELAYIDLPDLERISLYQADERAGEGEILTCLYLLPEGGGVCGDDPLTELLGQWDAFPYGLTLGASCDPAVTNVAVFGLPDDTDLVVFVPPDGHGVSVAPTDGIALAGWAGDGQPTSIALIGADTSHRYDVFPSDESGACSYSDQGPG
ncbi:MAG TPA: hypothetical protein VGC03_04085 [Acidimicrobiia bacterium]